MKPVDKKAPPPAPDDGVPRFGRLLIVLALAVIFVGILTYASVALYS